MKEKILKLIATCKDSGATEHEKDTAGRLARNICKKYGISFDELFDVAEKGKKLNAPSYDH
ncbi:hypothetical protein NO1_0256 [Candidatus Termititenax aidoneus]|uniref:DUF2786 domain-containing protein n=1 Tax=Termititenax aidoneus TaxID=2218524 RepID=A0A388T8T2_TERA1|nr:hypothetical protein NO1_0256 [Candidatus Termititenax aidoneus]